MARLVLVPAPPSISPGEKRARSSSTCARSSAAWSVPVALLTVSGPRAAAPSAAWAEVAARHSARATRAEISGLMRVSGSGNRAASLRGRPAARRDRMRGRQGRARLSPASADSSCSHRSRPMSRSARLLLLVVVLLATATATARSRNVTDPEAPRSLPAEGPVQVQWTDPSDFSDLKFSGNRWRAAQGSWVEDLAQHMRDSAEKRLPAGERLEVTITDLHRAGRYEPWRGLQMQDVRFVRDHYPPSM